LSPSPHRRPGRELCDVPGNIGLIGVLADAALAGGGQVVGVIPHAPVERELAHARWTELHVAQTTHERKALMADRRRRTWRWARSVRDVVLKGRAPDAIPLKTRRCVRHAEAVWSEVNSRALPVMDNAFGTSHGSGDQWTRYPVAARRAGVPGPKEGVEGTVTACHCVSRPAAACRTGARNDAVEIGGGRERCGLRSHPVAPSLPRKKPLAVGDDGHFPLASGPGSAIRSGCLGPVRRQDSLTPG
jgi:hypothetical protein